MPETAISPLDVRGPSLLPGESSLSLVADPYYGMVEAGGGLKKAESDRARGFRLQREVAAGLLTLTGDTQNRVEVLIGKHLQSKAPVPRDEMPSVDLDPPVLSSVSPDTGVAGESVELKLTGTGFVEDSKVVFDTMELPTTFTSETELTATVNLADKTASSTPSKVGVLNPDDAMSEPKDFTVTAAAPSNGGVTPTQTTAAHAAEGNHGHKAAAAAQVGKPVAPAPKKAE